MLEHFKTPRLPTMLEGSVMCVDSKAWNALVEYVNNQTNTINNLVDFVNALKSTSDAHESSIQFVAETLEEILEQK